jgi:hypothetical protein
MPSEGHPPHQLAAYCLPNGVHKPTDPKNDLASQWVIVTSEYTAKMTVIRAAIKIAPIQFIAALAPHQLAASFIRPLPPHCLHGAG